MILKIDNIKMRHYKLQNSKNVRISIFIPFKSYAFENVLKEGNNLEAVLKEHLQNPHQVKSRRNNDLFVYL